MRLTETNLRVGESVTLNPTVVPSNATLKTVTWTSESESIASVSSNGTVTGVSNGDAVITGTTVDGGYQVHCTVTVYGGDGIERNAEDMNNTIIFKDGRLFIMKRVNGEEMLFTPSGQRVK